MKFIVITPPDFIADEARLVRLLFDEGLDTLHLRKPRSTAEECARLLDDIIADSRRHGVAPEQRLRRIVLNDHHELCARYGLQGVHLNSRNPATSLGKPFTVSASCHSLGEVAERRATLDYVFLSPIFDSISKQGYGAAFSPDELAEAASQGLIDQRVMALGGVDLSCIGILRKLHFGGAAFLGDVWNRREAPEAFAVHAREIAAALHAGMKDD